MISFENLKKSLNIIPKKYTPRFLFIFFSHFLTNMLEIVGLGILPIVVVNIVNPEKLQEFLYEKKLDLIATLINENTSITLIFIYLIFFFLFKNTLILYLNYLQRKLGVDTINWNRYLIFSNYFLMDYKNSIKKNPSSLINSIVQEVPFASSTIEHYLLIFREIFLIIFIFLIALFINPIATVIITLLLILFVYFYYFLFQKSSKSRGDAFRKHRLLNLKIINETFDLLKEIKIYNKVFYFLNEFSTQLRLSEKYKLINSIVNSLPRLALEVGLLIICLGLIEILNLFNVEVNEIIPILTFIAVSSLRLIPSFKVLASSINQINFANSSLNIVSDEILQCNQDYNIENLSKKNFNKKTANREIIDTIKFKNVYFKYSSTNKYILKNINISFNKGERVGIIGESGSGKSTLINLLLGLLKPVSGKIEIESNNKILDLQNVENIFGYVPQNISVLNQSILKNIALGEDENSVDYQLLKEVLKTCNMESLIENLEKKEDTVIDNKGVNFSGGQVQRIGIARALYRKPKILIMDEATNALDYKNEKEIIDEVINLEKNMIILIIAHRIECLEKCDRIIKVSNHEIIEIDKSKLIQKN